MLTVDGDKLDYELQQIWPLIIDVSDGLNSIDSYSFNVLVEDEPDNRPEWQSVPSVTDITEGISEVSNLFATSEPPKYLNSNSPKLCFDLF